MRRRLSLFILGSFALGGCFAVFSLEEYGPPPNGSPSSLPDGSLSNDGQSSDVTTEKPRPTGKMVFVTSAAFDRGKYGDTTFRSIDDANAICADAAKKANLSGTFAAWLGHQDSFPAKNFTYKPPTPPNGQGGQSADLGPQLINPAFEIVATSYAALLDAGPLVPLLVTENGTRLAQTAAMTEEKGAECPDGGLVWTGTTSWGSGVSADSNATLANCNRWEAVGEGQRGLMGILRAHPTHWTAACEERCNMIGHLYCFEQ